MTLPQGRWMAAGGNQFSSQVYGPAARNVNRRQTFAQASQPGSRTRLPWSPLIACPPS